jgi:hypothetical protein
MKKSAFAIASLLLATLVSCDQVDAPFKDYGQLQGNTDQKVLLEDFTGHRCGNCPPAHLAAAELDEIYGDQLVVVTVHGGNLANPVPSSGYTADYRTEMGAALVDHWNVGLNGFPKGLINRRTFGSRQLAEYSAWGGYVAAILTEKPKVKLDLQAVLDPSTGQVDINSSVEYLEGGNFNHQLVVLLTEDSLVSKQTYYFHTPEEVEDYLHRHVLRASITEGAWGTPLVSGQVPVGRVVDKDFAYILDPTWVSSRCAIVAYVMDAGTKEVLQVEEVELD